MRSMPRLPLTESPSRHRTGGILNRLDSHRDALPLRISISVVVLGLVAPCLLDDSWLGKAAQLAAVLILGRIVVAPKKG